MNIDKLDRILLSKGDVDLLFEWRDNHKDYVRQFKPVLKEGIIVVEDYHNQVFQDEGSFYRYTIFVDNQKVYELYWNKETKIGTVILSKMKFDQDDEVEYNNSVISLHASIMAYMEYYSDNKEYVEVKEVITTKNKKKSTKSGSKKKAPIKIRKKIYKVSVNQTATQFDKRRYERKIESWTVSGHWRNYKNGNKVWIESYPKGKGDKTPKEFKL
jgi:hypothetical protein